MAVLLFDSKSGSVIWIQGTKSSSKDARIEPPRVYAGMEWVIRPNCGRVLGGAVPLSLNS